MNIEQDVHKWTRDVDPGSTRRARAASVVGLFARAVRGALAGCILIACGWYCGWTHRASTERKAPPIWVMPDAGYDQHTQQAAALVQIKREQAAPKRGTKPRTRSKKQCVNTTSAKRTHS